MSETELLALAKSKPIWGIHGGSGGEADKLFLEGNGVALGWVAMGDLGELSPSREAFKAAVAAAYPKSKPGAIPNVAGQLFRFVHEAKVGDLVAYPSKSDRAVHVGVIEGPYRYAPSVDSSYPQQRKVQWLCSVPRTSLSQGALYELGSAMSFFQVRNYADELRARLAPSASPLVDPEVEAASVKVVAEEVVENTHDFVLKRLAQELKGHPLAVFVADVLGTLGYVTRVSPPGADGGVDILAHRDELGFEPPIIKVQVKSSTEKVGDPAVKSLYGAVDGNEHGLFVTLGSFTPAARQFERTKTNLRLIDGTQFVDMVLAHYHQLSPSYQGIIPLKRVYVPQPTKDDRD